MSKRIRRTRRPTATEVAAILKDYQNSDLSQREFARQRGISLSNLVYWLGRQRKRGQAAGPLVEVELSRGVQPAIGAEPYRVEWSNGKALNLPRGFDPLEARQLLQWLQEGV